MTTGPCSAAPLLNGCDPDLGRAGTRRRSAGDDLPAVSLVDRLHTVSVALVDTASDREEKVEALRHRLPHFHLLIAHDSLGRTVLALTIEARDLWLALLLAINAVTSTG